MKLIILKDFGTVLTGRELGFRSYKILADDLEYPVAFDFTDVSAMGSSFGDEFIVPIANKQDKTVYISNANPVVMSCLQDIAEEYGLIIESQMVLSK
ncbi:MAG: hypothetical protein ACD_62C00348G0003 [uncultured bacterium]|nr:MAG: hypothetical protein ACD_62C00348G0003 [uncultured bacterium]